MSYFKGIGSKSGLFAGRKLPLVGLLGNKKHTIFNEYIAGSGVGASSVSTRRLKKQRARIKCAKPKKIIETEIIGSLFQINDSEINEKTELPLIPLTFNFGSNENNDVAEIVFNNHLNRVINKIKDSGGGGGEYQSLTFATVSTVLFVIDESILNDSSITISEAVYDETINEGDIFFVEHEIIEIAGKTTYNVNVLKYIDI